MNFERCNIISHNDYVSLLLIMFPLVLTFRASTLRLSTLAHTNMCHTLGQCNLIDWRAIRNKFLNEVNVTVDASVKSSYRFESYGVSA